VEYAALAAMAAMAGALAAIIARLSSLGRRTWISFCLGFTALSVSLLCRLHYTPSAQVFEHVLSLGAAAFFIYALTMYRSAGSPDEKQTPNHSFWRFVIVVGALLSGGAIVALLVPAPGDTPAVGLLAKAQAPLWIVANLVMMGLLRGCAPKRESPFNATAGTLVLTAVTIMLCFNQPPLAQYRPQGVAEALTIVTVLLGIWFLFSSLATVLRAEAVEHKRLYEQMFREATQRRFAEEQAARRNAELSTMLRVSNAISSAQELDDSLEAVATEVLELLATSWCSIRLLDDAGWVATKITAATREPDGSVRSFRHRAVPGDAAQAHGPVSETGEPDATGDLDDLHLSGAEDILARDYDVKATMSVRLVAEGTHLGFLCVQEHERDRTFTPDEVALCHGIATQISMGLHRARLMDELKKRSKQLESLSRSLRDANRALARLAAVDTTTGVYNRRLLEVKLKSEIDRCERYGQSLCIIMADLDNFKEYNDQAGHPAGDKALQRIASTLTKATRTSDAVGRFGGDEFVVVLPETTPEEAVGVADKVRSMVAELDLPGQELMENGGVTISCGIARWVGAGDHWEALIRRADDALYRAKDSGANAVCVAPEP